MKNIILFLSILCLNVGYGQKKKVNTTNPNLVLARTNSATVVFNKKKDLYLVVQKDSMLLCKSKQDFNPTNVKITEVRVKANSFYNVSWNALEKKDSSERKEIATITENQIWNPLLKALLFGNIQKVVEINEIQYLDKLKTASQTVTKKRSEGSTFALLPTGEFTLSNKTNVQKYGYNEKTSKYEPLKK